MLRDFKLPRRNSSKNLKLEETENVPVNSNLRQSSIGRLSTDSHSRPPLNTIQEPLQNPSKPDYELGLKSNKIYRTPTKPKVRNQESGIPLKTPEKQGGLARNRYGWGQDPCRTLPKGSSEANSTHSTPTKSASKPANLGFVNGGSSRPPVNGGVRTGNFNALSKGIPVAYNTCLTVNTVEVPHFDLREDPSFWMDHNVQVLIRIRPLNGMEISSQGYNRCLKQESAQSLTWVAQPETRFTFDHVACETIDQETLFRMVGQPMVENCLSGYNSCMFAYGQTGSGKTHTMLGEINDLEIKPSSNRGMTPRIFEFLFARIFAEEESRMDERLKYTCKCSFLEIYNEQIADLLDPSSTNLQLREDVKKGVYVENLTEYEVHCVGDILKLLSQGSANRRVAATNMNRESSRSHSVFTCVIESRWEKDSTSNLRFARLNLVDLAGSERQKTSGAEGERLKEAANINKSLSTLGHVIMVLVDGNARTRHVPYRDSRLTFLLQDSLGGNSKTMIIANVSPSISSAIETLNTLKFAQRAKLIQNNAVINEDASGDVVALQNQIRLLKEELAILKRHNTPRSLTFSSNDEKCSNTSSYGVDDKVLRISCNQLKSLESSLNGSLRREKSTENCIKQLEAEIEQLNCLVRQREEENRCTKMMLKFREDKIQKMESVFTGLISADTYLIEENNALTEEIKILRAKVDRNPEVTRFAVENIRLLEQLKRFQDFYEEGEREMLLAEVSDLRDQLALVLDENNRMNLCTEKEAAEDKKEIDSLQSELKKTQEELEKCRDNLNSCLEKNTKLSREIYNLNALLEMQKSSPNDQDVGIAVMKESTLESSSIEDQPYQTAQQKDEIFRKYPEEIMSLQLELEFLKHILEEERLIRRETEDKFSVVTKTYEKSILNEKGTQQELTLLREKCEEKDRNFNNLSQEFDFLTNKIEEVLTVGCNALDDASNFIGHGKQTPVCENLQIIARKISEKELRIDELNTCLKDAKLRGNEMETMLRSLRGAILVMSEAHQKDCIRKDEEIDKLLSELNEKNSIIIQMEEQIKEYEAELMDAMKNTAQQALKSFYYLDKFEELQLNIKEADCIINNLVNENEAMTTEINELKRQETTFINEREILKDNCLILEKQHKIDAMGMKRTIKVTNEKNEELRRSEEKLVTDLIAKDIELYMMSSKLENVMNEKDEELRCAEEKLVMDLFAKDIELYMMSSKLENVMNEKDEELRCAEEKLVMDLFAKDIELFMMSSKLENAMNQKDEELRCAEEKLVTDLLAKDIELFMMSSKLENVMNQKDEELRCAEEKLVTDLLAKDIELFMMSSKLENVMNQKDIELRCAEEKLVTDLLAKDIELFMMSSKLENVMNQKDEELRCAEEKLVTDLLAKDIELFMMSSKLVNVMNEKDEELRCAEEKLVMDLFAKDMELFMMSSKLENVMNEKDEELRCAEEKLVTDLFAKDIELFMMSSKLENVMNEKDEELRCAEEKLLMDLFAKDTEFFMMSSKLEQLSSENKDLKKDRISVCKDFEKFKEDIIISNVDLQFKDLILLELDADLRSYKEENDTLSVKIKKQKEEIVDIENFSEALECELYENIVKSLVLESWLTENVEDALIAKKSMQQLTYFQEVELTDVKIKVQDAYIMINKLVTENEAMTTEISHQNQVINAKETELFIILSKLEQVASDNNDLEKEKINVCSVFEKFKEQIIVSYLDLHFKDLILLENDAEVGALQMSCEASKRYDVEKLKLYEKTVEELESTVILLENQVDLVKADAESQRLKKEELEEEVKIIHQQKQLLITENETLKTQNEVHKTKVIELEDEVKKLLGQHQQHILPLEKIKEENNVLKAQNDENSDKLRKAEAMVARVKEDVANLRASNRRIPC